MSRKLSTVLALGYGQPPGGYAPPGQQPQYAPPPAPPMYAPPGPQPQYAPPPQQVHISIKLDRSVILPLIVVIVAMVFFIVACVTPWYTVNSKSSGGAEGYSYTSEYTSQMDSQGMTSTGKSTSSFGGTSSHSETRSWANYTENYKDRNNGASPKLPSLYTADLALSVAALVLAILAMVLLLMKKSQKLLAVILVVGGVLGIVAIAILAGLQPGYIRDDSHYTDIPKDGPASSFMGTNNTGSGGFTQNYSWGPGIGWYMALVGSIMMFVAVAILFLRKPKQQPVYPQPYPAPAQPYQQPPAGYGPPGYQPPPQPPMQQGYAPPPFQQQPGMEQSQPQYGGYPAQQPYSPPPPPPQQPGPPYNNPPPQ